MAWQRALGERSAALARERRGAIGQEDAGSSSPLRVRPEVVALLQSHGARAAAAQRIGRAGETLRRRTAESGVEVAALLDLETGRPVGPTLEGSEDRVDLAPQLALLHPGRRYVHLHTHPGSSSFSYYDLGLLLRYPSLRTLVVVGEGGSWYLLSKRRAQPITAPATAIDLWRVRYAEIASHYDPLVESGALTEAEALRRELHETMERLAPELRLRYDHVEPLS
jgi:hypothetical protein